MLLIRGGTLVDRSGERAGDVLIDGEAIAAVGQGIEAPEADVIDASGALVIPGGIDAHTHFDLPVGRVRSADDFETDDGKVRTGMLVRTVLDEYTYLDPKGNLFKLNTRRIVDSRAVPKDPKTYKVLGTSVIVSGSCQNPCSPLLVRTDITGLSNRYVFKSAATSSFASCAQSWSITTTRLAPR